VGGLPVHPLLKQLDQGPDVLDVSPLSARNYIDRTPSPRGDRDRCSLSE
jgi:hypothetical protein